MEITHFQVCFAGTFNQWVSVVIPLNEIQSSINDIFSPFEITMDQPGGTCYIDDIRFVNPPAPDASIFDVAVKNISDQSSAGSMTWPAGIPATGWAASNQYIELQLDDPSDLSWGVQIYTTNTSAGASPKYTGAASTNPAGLVDAANPASVIPLAWSIKAGTQAPTAVAPAATDPNNSSDPNSFQWLFMKDAATPSIPAQNTTVFMPGEIPVTMKNNQGIHFGQSNTNIGAATPPNYIFLEANFDSAMAQHTYQTNSLVVEFFSE